MLQIRKLRLRGAKKTHPSLYNQEVVDWGLNSEDVTPKSIPFPASISGTPRRASSAPLLHAWYHALQAAYGACRAPEGSLFVRWV